LNGVKATIIFHKTANSLVWDLVVERGDTKASIDGYITLDTLFETFTPHPSPVSEPVTEPVTEPESVEEEEEERRREKKREEEKREERREKQEEKKRKREEERRREKKREEEKREEKKREEEKREERREKREEKREEERREKKREEERREARREEERRSQRESSYTSRSYENWTKSLQLIEKNEELKNTSIQRAYPIKEECNDFPDMILSIDPFLKDMKAPIVAPVTDEDMKNHIHKYVKEIQATVGRKEKAKLAQILYDYMTNESLDYVKGYEKLKNAAIERANSFKKDCKEFPELIASLNAFLTAVGDPLDERALVIKEDSKEFPELIESLDNFLTTTGAPLDEEKGHSQWMKNLLIIENLTFNDKVMDLYYEYEKTSPRLNRFKNMKAFIKANRDALVEPVDPQIEAHKTLMMSIFQKKNLEFKDVYMDMYYEWQKNAPKLNRYKKMCAFIDAHGM
jgi:hypothetical protein